MHKIDILCTRVNRVNQIMKQMRYNIIRYTIRFKVYLMIWCILGWNFAISAAVVVVLLYLRYHNSATTERVYRGYMRHDPYFDTSIFSLLICNEFVGCGSFFSGDQLFSCITFRKLTTRSFFSKMIQFCLELRSHFPMW